MSIDPRNDRIVYYENILDSFIEIQGKCDIRGAAEKIVELEEKAAKAPAAEQPDGCRTAFEKRHWPTFYRDRDMMKRMRGKEPYNSSYREWSTAWQLALAYAPMREAGELAAAKRVITEWERDMAGTLATLEAERATAKKLAKFVAKIARMNQDGEEADGKEFVMENDDAVITLNELIAEARELSSKKES